MTIAPDRPDLEELDFPTPDLVTEGDDDDDEDDEDDEDEEDDDDEDDDEDAALPLTWQTEDAVLTEFFRERGVLSPYSSIYGDRDWYCYCSPSRFMLYTAPNPVQPQRNTSWLMTISTSCALGMMAVLLVLGVVTILCG